MPSKSFIEMTAESNDTGKNPAAAGSVNELI